MNMPNKVPFENGTPAEEAAARKFNLDLKSGTTDFWDATYSSNGRKVQIKSARYERADGPGVFRVWREHLLSLSRVGGSVVVVVLNPANPSREVLKVEKVSPRLLLETGDFRPTGQQDMRGKHEARIPWPEIVTL